MRTGSRSGGIGTHRYLAPEFFSSSETSRGSVSTDTYASAVTIWSLASAEVPFAGVNDYAVIVQVVEGKRPQMPETFGSFRSHSEPARFVWNLMVQMWHESPEVRPPMLFVKNELGRIRNDGLIVVTENAEKGNLMSSSLEVGRNRWTTYLKFQPCVAGLSFRSVAYS